MIKKLYSKIEIVKKSYKINQMLILMQKVFKMIIKKNRLMHHKEILIKIVKGENQILSINKENREVKYRDKV